MKPIDIRPWVSCGTRTKDVRPWWWWINPWLYIKRRDIAYDTALDIVYELQYPNDAPPR